MKDSSEAAGDQEASAFTLWMDGRITRCQVGMASEAGEHYEISRQQVWHGGALVVAEADWRITGTVTQRRCTVGCCINSTELT